MKDARLWAVLRTVGLAGWLACLGAETAAGAEGKVLLTDQTHWKVCAVRGPMRLDGKVLRNPAECHRHTITRSYLRSMSLATKRLLQGQHIDWKKADWRDFAVYCPDIIGNPYYPRMMSLVRQEYPPEDWMKIGEIWTRFIKGGRSPDPQLRRYRCPAPPRWNGYRGPWLNREGWNRLLKLRDREIGPVSIPGKLLRKGPNVLAVELRGSLHHPLIFAPGIWGHGKAKRWNQGKSWCHLRLVRLKLDDPSGTLPSAMQPPKQLRVWAEDMHSRLYGREYRPTTMPTGRLKFVGALNGHFSGMLSVMSGRKIEGLSVGATDLEHAAGKGTIPKDRITVTGLVGHPLTDMSQLGVHIKGLDRSPMNFMAKEALAHTLNSPFVKVPRIPGKDWAANTAGKTLFYDHISAALPRTIPANVLQPLWVRLDVPMKTVPGTYTGRITVQAKGAKPIVVPVEAEVIDWRVPGPREFVTDMGLEHHPYAVANHYLLPKDAQARPRDRDWRGPVKARVPLWSDEHFRLLVKSFKQMARAGNDLLFIPVLHRTEFGNWEDSMIKWIRRKDGAYDFDFKIMDRFLDLAVRHMGTPRVICFVIMHCQLASPTPAVTVYDEAKGKHETLTLGWKQDAFNRLPVWRQFGAAVLRHMQGKGLEQSVYWGHGGDHESDPALMGLFWELFPNHYWAASGHTYHGGAGGGGHSRNVVRYFADVYGAASPVESKKGWKGAYIGGGPSVVVGTQYAASSIGKAQRLIRNETYLYVHIPRDELRGAAQPIRWRGIPSVSLHRGYCGLGHIGFDGYHHIYLDGYIGGDWAFPGRPHHMVTWPGPDGAEPSARYEALLEGIQEGEARIFLEQTVDRKLVSTEMAKKIQDVLLDYLHHYCLWPQLRGDSVHDYIHPWQDDSRKLYRIAAKVARIVGVDIGQLNLRTKVAALGRTHRTLLIRNWTGVPRPWTARTDAPWLKLKEKEGQLLGFRKLAYHLDGEALKPGQTVTGNIYVKDVATGREQTFAVIADVIDPIELRFDHPNFNMRCGKSEARRFRLVSNAVLPLEWTLSAKQPWLRIEPASGTIPAGKDAFITLTASPPDKTAATHDNGLLFAGARGLVRKPVRSRTFVIPLLREKEERKMPYGKIIKLEDIGKRWTFFGTCLKGTKIEMGAVREIGRAHTKALTNPSEGPPCARKEFLPIIGNERFSRAMWVYPHHESVFDLKGSRIRAFSAYVGVSNDARRRLIRNQHRKASFEVWVDGGMLCLLVLAAIGCDDKQEKRDADVRYDADGKPSRKEGRKIAEWITKLDEGEARDQANAARVLGYIGPEAKEAVPALAAKLDSADEPLRLEAAAALVKIGDRSEKVVQTLTDAVRFVQTDLRISAIELLGTIGQPAQSAIPDLVQLLNDPSEIVRQKTVGTLGKIGPAAYPALAKALGDPNKKVVEAADAILASAGAEVIPSLSKLAASRDEVIRERAGTILAKHGRQAVPSFLEAFKSLDEEVRFSAVQRLKDLGPNAEPALPQLIGALKDTNTHVCNEAQLALARIGRPAVKALIDSLDDRDPYARKLSIDALVQIGEPAEKRLTEALEGRSEVVRIHSAAALVKLKASARDALPVLVRGLKGPDKDFAILAARTLAEASPDLKGHMPALVEALGRPQKEVRVYTAGCIRRLGAAGRQAVPALMKLLDEKDEKVVIAALGALAAIGKHAKAAVSRIDKLTDHDNFRIVGAAEDALKAIR